MAWDSRNVPAVAASAAGAAAGLRPLSIGELFDRAFNVYFRNILTFSAILLVMLLPLVLLQYFIYKDSMNASLDLFQAIIQHPGTPPDMSKIEAVQGDPLVQFGLSMLYYGLAFFTVPLANAAVVSGISRAYLGMPVRFADCYRHAFSRWGWVLLLVFLWGIVTFFLFFALAFGGVLLAVILTGVAQLLRTPGEILAAVVGIALFLAFVALVVMGYMAYASSFTATVLEKIDPIRAFTLGVSRIFGGHQFWRSFVVAWALVFLGLAFALVTAIAGGLISLATKSAVFYLLCAYIAQVFYTALAFAVVAVYYYDIRIRREGFDLQLLADQIAASAAPRPAPPAPPAATS